METNSFNCLPCTERKVPSIAFEPLNRASTQPPSHVLWQRIFFLPPPLPSSSARQSLGPQLRRSLIKPSLIPGDLPIAPYFVHYHFTPLQLPETNIATNGSFVPACQPLFDYRNLFVRTTLVNVMAQLCTKPCPPLVIWNGLCVLFRPPQRPKQWVETCTSDYSYAEFVDLSSCFLNNLCCLSEN